jgi:plastocyanin
LTKKHDPKKHDQEADQEGTSVRRVPIALIAVLVLVSGSACSRSNASGPVPCVNPVTTTVVTLADFSFTPSCTAAAPGATLSITDAGAIPHTFTVKGTSVDVTIAAGETKQVTLMGVAAGTYAVVCRFHPNMVGSLKVG